MMSEPWTLAWHLAISRCRLTSRTDGDKDVILADCGGGGDDAWGIVLFMLCVLWMDGWMDG